MKAAAVSLDSLRARVRAMERLSPAPSEPLALPVGSLTLACLHQIVAVDATATGFAAFIAGRLAERLERPVMWLPIGGDLHPPGLAAWGLAPGRLMMTMAGDRDRLWAMEEALRCPDLACVVAEIGALDLTAGRRLQLAAEAGGVTGLALHPAAAAAAIANAGTTRWRVAAAPEDRWRLTLERCRGGLPGEWEITPPRLGEGGTYSAATCKRKAMSSAMRTAEAPEL